MSHWKISRESWQGQAAVKAQQETKDSIKYYNKFNTFLFYILKVFFLKKTTAHPGILK